MFLTPKAIRVYFLFFISGLSSFYTSFYYYMRMLPEPVTLWLRKVWAMGLLV